MSTLTAPASSQTTGEMVRQAARSMTRQQAADFAAELDRGVRAVLDGRGQTVTEETWTTTASEFVSAVGRRSGRSALNLFVGFNALALREAMGWA